MFCGFAVAGISPRADILSAAPARWGRATPAVAGLRLGALGALLIGRSLILDGEPDAAVSPAPLAVIAVAVCLFGLLVEPLGLSSRLPS